MESGLDGYARRRRDLELTLGTMRADPLRDRLMVGRPPLEREVGVRVPVPQLEARATWRCSGRSQQYGVGRVSDVSPDPMFDPERVPKARGDGSTIPITSFSVEQAVENGTFRWEPVLIDRSPRPKALYLMWRAFQYVFDDIDDPRAFRPLSDAPTEDLTIFRGYIDAAEQLAESELLCGSDGYTFSWRAATETAAERQEVESSFTSDEITHGFAALLRQFDSDDEPASFRQVSGRLRGLSAETSDSHAGRRLKQIDAWRWAEGKLHGAELHRLARRKLTPGVEIGNPDPPTYYLSAYNYGELIHWDRGRETLAAWEKDPFWRAHERMAFLEAATSLAYVYIGFSEIVRAALRSADAR